MCVAGKWLSPAVVDGVNEALARREVDACVLVGSEGVTQLSTAAVDHLRAKGEKAGSIHVNVLRPTPEAACVAALAGKKAADATWEFFDRHLKP